MFYVNKDRSMVVNGKIVEWDIKSGNTSMMYTYKMFPKKVIDAIHILSKQKRVVAIGKLMKKNKEFSKQLEQAFNSTIQQFVTINDIPKENIISIKRDAVYVLNHDIKYPTIGEYIEFVPKNTYDGWMYLSPFEFYHATDHIDVKGLNDEFLPLHENGILDFINELFITCASTNKDPGRINEFLADFVKHYKNKELIDDYYREFSNDSQYRLQYPEGDLLVESLAPGDLEYLDISYNYIKIIMPIIRELC